MFFIFYFFKWPQGSTMYFENFFKKIKINFYIYIYDLGLSYTWYNFK